MSGAKAITIHLADFTTPRPPRRPPPLGGAGARRWLIGRKATLAVGAFEFDDRCWSAFGLWEDLDDAVVATASPGELVPWMAGAERQWHAVAVPVRVLGTSNHTFDGTAGTPCWEVSPDEDGDGPVISMTTAAFDDPNADPARLGRFVTGQFHLTDDVVRDAPGNLGHRDVVAFPFRSFDGCNLTLWRDLEAMQGFAYRAGEHRSYVDSHRSTPAGWFDRSSFTRFRPVRAWETLNRGAR
ncbi:MAG: hypothetical protein R2755_28605 [Acidimicrobiales bacterium]